MIYINEKNKNEMITLEEANEILTMAKRLYPGQLSGVYIEEDMDFALYRDSDKGMRRITIPTLEFDDGEYYEDYNVEDFAEIGEKVINHINREFGYDFEPNIKTMCIHAVCHEIGHAIDFYTQEYLGNNDYEECCDEEYEVFYRNTHMYHQAVDDLNDYIEEYGIYVDHEVIKSMTDDIRVIENRLDREYRLITSERNADEFGAHFMNTYLSYLKFMFKEA